MVTFNNLNFYSHIEVLTSIDKLKYSNTSQCVFMDATNKKLYYTSDNGRNIHRSDLTFHPSELTFDEEYPDKYVILDKVDTNRKVSLTFSYL